MGTSYYVYVGPYIEVRNPEEDGFREHFGCAKAGCRLQGREASSKFCPQCGSEIGLVKTPEKTRRKFDIYGQTDERLCESLSYMPEGMEDYHIYVPNVKGYGKHFSSWDSQVIPMNETVIADETCRFFAEFSGDISKIRAFFGDKNVRVLWGVLAYAS